jgi:hypothetical protein
VIVGGRWSGMRRAVRYSGLYIGAYFLAGFPLLGVLSVILAQTEMGIVWPYLAVGHFVSLVVLYPAAVAANFVALKVFRPRSWRRQSWRGWVAGVLGIPFCWAGVVVWGRLPVIGPGVVHGVARAWVDGITMSGAVILASSLALLVGWLLPPWRVRPA